MKNGLLFLVAGLFKLLLFSLFSSDYPDRLFLPFLHTAAENFLTGNWEDPWTLYAFIQPDAFPYHPLMLYLYGAFQLPAVFFPVLSKPLFVVPSLGADILIYLTLLKMFPQRKKAVLFLYSLSPVLIYSIYMHGQLDLFPTALLFYSLYLLINEKFIKSSIFLGLSLSVSSSISQPQSLCFYGMFSEGKIFQPLCGIWQYFFLSTV